MPREHEFLRGLAWNAPAIIGGPADLAETAINLGLAAGGYAGHTLGLLRPDQLPELLSGSPGTTKWWVKGTPLEESADPRFVSGQVAGGLATALYGGLAEMRLPRKDQLNAITWHGSPHKFDKFDSAHIGKGEGAQAYGHGLYLADLRSVAKTYADMAATRDISFDQAADALWPLLRKQSSFADDTVLFGPLRTRMNKAQFTQRYMANPDAVWADLSPQMRTAVEDALKGNLYKVDLPDEAIARMLAWDKPLSQQAPGVRDGVAKAMRAKGFDEWQVKAMLERDITGKQANAFIGGIAGQSKTPEFLRQAGIPGIRYLDGNSRGAGAGTSNYVVFPGEEHQLTILERNGVPLLRGLASGRSAPKEVQR